VDFKAIFWQLMPASDQISQGLCRRMARNFPEYCSKKLQAPVFIVGFNNGGKSTIVRQLINTSSMSLYPYEGNKELWFRGFYPWAEAQPDVGPIWHNPEEFVSAVLATRDDDFLLSRAYLGAYQLLVGGDSIMNDSGMLGALLPEILSVFPDAKFIHVVRDGRVASYLSARREWCNMMRSPANYQKKGCSLDFQDVLGRMINYWSWTEGRINSVAEKVPGQVYKVRYEDWCNSPDEVFSNLREFVSEGDASTASIDAGRIVNMNGYVEREFSEQDVSTFSSVSGPLLREMGYLK